MPKSSPNQIKFPGADGQILAARLDVPSGPIRATALFAHCFTCSKDILAASRIAKALVAQGFAVMRFDFTGLGASEGEFANTNFSSNLDDLRSATDYLRQQGTPASLLIGHSLGGAAVLAIAAEIEDVKAVATVGAPADIAHVAESFALQHDDIERDGEAQVSLAGRPFTIKKQFLDDVRSHALTERVSRLKKPLLILHAPRDETVGIENATNLFVAAKHPKSFVSLDDADHLLTREADATYAADVIAAWAKRFIPDAAAAPEENALAPTMGNEVVVRETDPAPFAQSISVRAHTLKADEPASYGGADTGPTPYDFLAIALGTCTSMTLRMYANRKQLPVSDISVVVNHEKIHADDCESCEEKKHSRIDHFTREISWNGDLDAGTADRFMEIADMCPVHKTLEQSSKISTVRRAEPL